MARVNTIRSFPNDRAEEYKSWRAELDAMARKSHPKHDLYQAAVEDAKLYVKAAPTTSEVHQNQVLTDIAIKYHNENLVGEDLMRVVFTQGSLSGTFYIYDSKANFGLPDNSVSEMGLPNEVSRSYTTDTVTLTGKALSAPVPQGVIQNADDPLQPLMDAAEQVAENNALVRESTILTAVMTAGNYGANTAAIGAADRWNTATGGDPAGDVDTAKLSCLAGGGASRLVGVMSPTVWNVLKRHPRFTETFKYVTGQPSAMAQACAEWLELDDIVVPRALYDTANEGAATTLAALCANSFAIVRVADRPQPRTAAFGFQFQDAPAATTQNWSDERGPRGGYTVKSGYNDVNKVCGALTSYLLTTPCG